MAPDGVTVLLLLAMALLLVVAQGDSARVRPAR
jgi:hypothetical protein